MRWYGPNDPVPLSAIRQAGCTGVVTALHHVPVEDVWTVREIEKRRAEVEAGGLTWSVIESLPVHESIKTRSGEWRRYVDQYIESLRNVALAGPAVVTYNFMPVLDWSRTDVAYPMPDGSEALRFEHAAFAAFDVFMLERPGAADDYAPELLAVAKSRLDTMSDAERQVLAETVMLGLPGTDTSFTPQQLLSSLEAYAEIGPADLRANLAAFLVEITPVAAELGLGLAIHPDDPPFSVLGLPRVVSTASDLRAILAAADNPANGLCFCTGSLGARPDNDIPAMLDEFGDRIHFLHLRNTTRDANGDFYEANHLEGDTDMASVVARVVRIMARTGRAIPMRPDHGHRMLDDLGKTAYPGYTAIGRLRGLAELRGLEAAFLAG